MKAWAFGFRVLVAVMIWLTVLDVSAGRVNYRKRPPQNQTPAPVVPPPKPDPNDKLFKDIPVDTIFVYPSDKTHKWYQWVKISATKAKSVVTAAKPQSAVEPVAGEMKIYIVDAASQSKAH